MSPKQIIGGHVPHAPGFGAYECGNDRGVRVVQCQCQSVALCISLSDAASCE